MVICGIAWSWCRVPLGPFTVTTFPSPMVTSTPAGTVIGILPIRDISCLPPLPDKRQDFAADMVLASLLIGHDALGRGNDGDAQATENLGQLVGAGIDTQAGLGDAAETGNDLLLIAQVLQGDLDDALVAVLNELVGLNVALLEAGSWRWPSSAWKRAHPRYSCLAMLAFRIRVSISAMGSCDLHL